LASVTQCDACKSVVANEAAKYVRMYNCNKNGDTKDIIHAVDICPACYKKICEIIGVEPKHVK
jgi:hypothetical protein